jgi:hypothetical protein
MLSEHRQRVRRRQLLALSGMALAIVLLAVGLTSNTPPPRESAAARAAVAEGGFEEGVDASVVVTIGVPLPKKPLPNWKRPPCSQKQREINGACWKKLAAPPGDDMCGEDYEHEGSCWAPVAKPQKAPLTIQPAEE